MTTITTLSSVGRLAGGRTQDVPRSGFDSRLRTVGHMAITIKGGASMASSKTPNEVAAAFIEGRKPTIAYKTMFVSENTGHLVSYGDHFPVIILADTYLPLTGETVPALYINQEGANGPGTSRTTDRHVRSAHAMADRLGFSAIGREVEIDGHTFAVYA